MQYHKGAGSATLTTSPLGPFLPARVEYSPLGAHRRDAQALPRHDDLVRRRCVLHDFSEDDVEVLRLSRRRIRPRDGAHEPFPYNLPPHRRPLAQVVRDDLLEPPPRSALDAVDAERNAARRLACFVHNDGDVVAYEVREALVRAAGWRDESDYEVDER